MEYLKTLVDEPVETFSLNFKGKIVTLPKTHDLYDGAIKNLNSDEDCGLPYCYMQYFMFRMYVQDNNILIILLKIMEPFSNTKIENILFRELKMKLEDVIGYDFRTLNFDFEKIIKLVKYTNTTFDEIVDFLKIRVSKDFTINRDLALNEIDKDCNNILSYENYNIDIVYSYISLGLFENENVVKHIIDNFVDFEKERNGKRLVHYIFSYSTSNMMEYIINKGVDIECKNLTHVAPIHLACKRGSLNVIKLLVSKGVDLNARDIKGRTPLYYLCISLLRNEFSEEENFERFKYILDQKINLDCKVEYGEYPIQIAFKSRNVKVMKLFVDNDENYMEYDPSPFDILNDYCKELLKSKDFGKLKENLELLEYMFNKHKGSVSGVY